MLVRMDGLGPTIYEVAEQAARKPAGKKPRKRKPAARRVTRAKQAERGSGRVRKSGQRKGKR